jgi:orotate phosphoribosyltransferase
MREEEILKEFMASEAILKGHFILSSGLRSDTYLQCARVLMEAKRAEKLAQALAGKLRTEIGEDFDLVVSPAMGGVVIGYEMGRQLGKPAIFCEREQGVFAFRRGFQVPQGARVLLVEDVVTTAKSSRETIAAVEAQGGRVVAEACLVDRGNGAEGRLPVPLVSLLRLDVPTYDAERLPDHLKAISPVKPGSRGLK